MKLIDINYIQSLSGTGKGYIKSCDIDEFTNDYAVIFINSIKIKYLSFEVIYPQYAFGNVLHNDYEFKLKIALSDSWYLQSLFHNGLILSLRLRKAIQKVQKVFIRSFYPDYNNTEYVYCILKPTN